MNFLITVFENNDEHQAKEFAGATQTEALGKLEAWLRKNEPDVCLEMGEETDYGLMPVFALNYCESEGDWELREELSDTDIVDSGTFAEMLPLFLERARLNIEQLEEGDD